MECNGLKDIGQHEILFDIPCIQMQDIPTSHEYHCSRSTDRKTQCSVKVVTICGLVVVAHVLMLDLDSIRPTIKALGKLIQHSILDKQLVTAYKSKY